jgi:hypothetical protein
MLQSMHIGQRSHELYLLHRHRKACQERAGDERAWHHNGRSRRCLLVRVLPPAYIPYTRRRIERKSYMPLAEICSAICRNCKVSEIA